MKSLYAASEYAAAAAAHRVVQGSLLAAAAASAAAAAAAAADGLCIARGSLSLFHKAERVCLISGTQRVSLS